MIKNCYNCKHSCNRKDVSYWDRWIELIPNYRTLEQQISSLKAKLQIAEEALGFYGDRKNWRSTNHLKATRITSDDDDAMEMAGYHYGGKRARIALAKIKESV